VIVGGVSKMVVLNEVAFDTDGARVIDKPIFRTFTLDADGEKDESALLGGLDSPKALQQ
jgi:hypothetical protein